jgi:acyl transferase domain-containing protein
LECTYLALKDAGHTKESVQGRNIGVFVGIAVASFPDFASTRQNGDGAFLVSKGDGASGTGRVSFIFGLQGPCSTYSTACSSSLVATHAAVKSLQDGGCELAIVLGVNMLTSNATYALSQAGMITPTGRCHTFDAAADGYLRGEGCGALVLKRMDDVMADGDRVYAVIRGVGMAHDGKSASLTAPNGLAQEKLLRSTLKDARLLGRDIDYLEAHGTGTPLGDPIEMVTVAAVLGEGRDEECPLVVGAVKANIGHLEAVAGMAGLIKAVLVLQHEQAPPNPELKTLNPKIAEAVEGFPVHFPVRLESFREISSGCIDDDDNDGTDVKRLVVGVSSFGYAGTIAHTILSQAPQEVAREILAVIISPLAAPSSQVSTRRFQSLMESRA